MQSQSHLLQLPLELFQDVIRVLRNSDFEAFKSFRLVSRACREHSEALIFRTVKFSDGMPEDDDARSTLLAIDIGSTLLARLQNRNDVLRDYVRHLEIGPFVASVPEHDNDGGALPNPCPVECPQGTVLLSLLHKLENLAILSWNSWHTIPQELLEHLQSRPTIRLFVRHVDHYRGYKPIRRSLLSSRSLSSLEFQVYYQHIAAMDGRDFHEYKTLTACLLKAHNLKKLRLDSSKTHVPFRLSDFTHDPFHLNLEDGDIFPVLEELVFGELSRYVFSKDHCQIWSTCMDWSRLRRLEITGGAPEALFLALTGLVPQLKHLAFGIQYHPDQSAPTWYCSDVNVIKFFLDSIDGLSSVKLSAPRFNPLLITWPIPTERHGNSLRELDIDYQWSHQWEAAEFADLLSRSPGLETLDVSMALQSLVSIESRETVWPTETTEILMKFHRMRRATLKIIFERNSISLCKVERNGRLTLNKGAGEAIAKELFEQWRRPVKLSPLEKVKLVFTSLSPITEAYTVRWTFTAYRKWIPSEKGYDTVVDTEVVGEYHEKHFDDVFGISAAMDLVAHS